MKENALFVKILSASRHFENTKRLHQSGNNGKRNAVKSKMPDLLGVNTSKSKHPKHFSMLGMSKNPLCVKNSGTTNQALIWILQ